MYQVTLVSEDTQMAVRIIQTLGLYKMEIRPWDEQFR